MPGSFEVVRSTQCDADIEAIFGHLFEAYSALGEDPDEAFERAVNRVRGIEDAFDQLGGIPFQGTLAPRILDGLRYVTKDRAVFYFVTDEAERQVRVLAVFFGDQDHQRRILDRIAAVN